MSVTVTYHELPPPVNHHHWSSPVDDMPHSTTAFVFPEPHQPPGSIPVWNGNGFDIPDHIGEPGVNNGHWQIQTNPPPSPFMHTPSPGGYHQMSGRNSSAPSPSPSPAPMPEGKGKKRVTNKGYPLLTPPANPEELCLVCGDKASGYHYNALTCEGCKGFFRRSITKKARYLCKYGNNCDIDMYMRRKCQFCRLRKCFNIGMRPELVIPEDQCRLKRESKMRIRSAQNSRSGPGSPHQQVTSTESLSPPNSAGPLSADQRQLLQRLIYYQDQLDMPTNEDILKLSRFQTPNTTSEFQHLAELTILNVRLIMDFARAVPGFSKLSKEDQLTLLKAGTFEALMLKMCRRYDAKTDSILMGNQNTSWAYDRETYRQAGIGSATDAIFEFAKSLGKMKVDQSEYALLTAITIFSDRPCLLEPKKIEEIQEVYTSALQAYIDTHRPKQRTVFARMLMKLTDLRTLSSEHADSLFSLKVNGTATPTLEITPPIQPHNFISPSMPHVQQAHNLPVSNGMVYYPPTPSHDQVLVSGQQQQPPRSEYLHPTAPDVPAPHYWNGNPGAIPQLQYPQYHPMPPMSVSGSDQTNLVSSTISDPPPSEYAEQQSNGQLQLPVCSGAGGPLPHSIQTSRPSSTPSHRTPNVSIKVEPLATPSQSGYTTFGLTSLDHYGLEGGLTNGEHHQGLDNCEQKPSFMVHSLSDHAISTNCVT